MRRTCQHLERGYTALFEYGQNGPSHSKRELVLQFQFTLSWMPVGSIRAQINRQGAPTHRQGLKFTGSSLPELGFLKPRLGLPLLERYAGRHFADGTSSRAERWNTFRPY
jgi:hypothetical protein